MRLYQFVQPDQLRDLLNCRGEEPVNNATAPEHDKFSDLWVLRDVCLFPFVLFVLFPALLNAFVVIHEKVFDPARFRCVR
jgi:hypothetical protein